MVYCVFLKVKRTSPSFPKMVITNLFLPLLPDCLFEVRDCLFVFWLSVYRSVSDFHNSAKLKQTLVFVRNQHKNEEEEKYGDSVHPNPSALPSSLSHPSTTTALECTCAAAVAAIFLIYFHNLHEQHFQLHANLIIGALSTIGLLRNSFIFQFRGLFLPLN